MPNKIRTRIAPSPTGNLHIGTARTALFNYLFARQNNGEFLLRIEDTDQSRSTKEFEQDIIDGLKWLGMKWNGEIVKQSERADIYQKYIDALKEKNLIYEEPAKEGKGIALILKKPEGNITFTDLIREEVTFAEDQLSDLVIQKPDGTPTYNFAVAVDDHEMGITHVIRGEDHIPNTPKQLMVYKALGWDVPQFAHLPLILAQNRTKLSKRHGAQSIIEFKEFGFLPQAVVNYMGLLGWHPKNEKEIFTLDELVEDFRLEEVQKGGAIFDLDPSLHDPGKFLWINHQWIQDPKFSNEDLHKITIENVKRFRDPEFVRKKLTSAILGLMRDRIHVLRDVEDYLDWFREPNYESSQLRWKEMTSALTKQNLEAVLEILSTIDADGWNEQNIESKLMPYADEQGRGEILWPLRVALSGAEKSPGPFELAALLGREETINRIHTALSKLSE